jgi:hypothetical protein
MQSGSKPTILLVNIREDDEQLGRFGLLWQINIGIIANLHKKYTVNSC